MDEEKALPIIPWREIPRWLDAATVVVIIGALWFYMGYQYWESYFVGMGLPSQSVRLDPYVYIVNGFPPLIMLFSIAGLSALFFLVQRLGGKELFPISRQTALPLLALSSILTWLSSRWTVWFMAFAFDREIRPVPAGITADFLIAAMAIAGIMIALTPMFPWLRLAFGVTPTGRAVLLLIVFLCASGVAKEEGRFRAYAHLDPQLPHFQATIHDPTHPLDNRSFLLILHHGGVYYLRDLPAAGGETSVHVVPGDSVALVTIRLARES